MRINSGDNDGIETILVKKNKKGTTFYLLSLVNNVCGCSEIKNGLKIGHLLSCVMKRSFYDIPFFYFKTEFAKEFFSFYILKLQLFWLWFQGQRLSCNGENSEKFRKSMTSSFRDLPVRKPYSRSFGTKVGLIIRVHDGVLEPISIS